MRLSAGIRVLVLAQGMAGCTGSDSRSLPFAPSPTPQPTAIQVNGVVHDSAFRTLASATVEVLDGPQAGTSATADAQGFFSLTGMFDEATRFRATSEGHITTTRMLPSCQTCRSPRFIYFYLAVPTLPVDIAGEYTLTLTADSTCTGIPVEFRSRTLRATIAPAPATSNLPDHTYFFGAVSGALFLDYYKGFEVGVAGDTVTFVLGDDGPYVVEQVAPNTYLGFDGRAEASVGRSLSSISTPFQGRIDYCALNSPMGQFYSCGPSVVARAECQSSNHRLTVTRR